MFGLLRYKSDDFCENAHSSSNIRGVIIVIVGVADADQS